MKRRFSMCLAATALALAAIHPASAQEEPLPPAPLPPAPEPVETAAPLPDATPTPSGIEAAEAPSAELVIDAEEAVVEEPAPAPGEQPLPPMDGDAPFPGEENIFGDDLFGAPGMFMPEPMPDVPDVPPLIEDPKELERKLRVKLRKIKARLDRDPELLDLQAMAARAPTPEDHRAARRAYYALFFEKIRKADPGLSAYADDLEKSSLELLYQTRIEPTLALNPPPQPQPREEFIPKQQFPDSLPLEDESIPLP